MHSDDIEEADHPDNPDDLDIGGDAGQWFDENYTAPRQATEQEPPKRKNPLVYVAGLLLLAGCLGAVYLYMSDAEEARRKAAEIDTTVSLEDLASGLQASTLPAFLRTLQSQKSALAALEKKVYEKFPDPKDPTERRYRAETIADDNTFLDGFLNELIRNIDQAPGSSYWSLRPKPDFRLIVQQTLVSCGAHSADTCRFKLTHTPLVEHLSDLQDVNKKGAQPWVFIIVDAAGVGLADSHDPSWSNAAGFARTVPILADAVKEKKIGKASFKHSKTGRTIPAIAFPLLHGDQIVGAALVGELEPPRNAKEKQ